jgi:hypothetical protein
VDETNGITATFLTAACRGKRVGGSICEVTTGDGPPPIGIRRLHAEIEETQATEQHDDEYETQAKVRKHRMNHVGQYLDARGVKKPFAARFPNLHVFEHH